MSEFIEFTAELPEADREIIVKNRVSEWEANSNNVKEDTPDPYNDSMRWTGLVYAGYQVTGLVAWKYKESLEVKAPAIESVGQFKFVVTLSSEISGLFVLRAPLLGVEERELASKNAAAARQEGISVITDVLKAALNEAITQDPTVTAVGPFKFDVTRIAKDSHRWELKAPLLKQNGKELYATNLEEARKEALSLIEDVLSLALNEALALSNKHV